MKLLTLSTDEGDKALGVYDDEGGALAAIRRALRVGYSMEVYSCEVEEYRMRNGTVNVRIKGLETVDGPSFAPLDSDAAINRAEKREGFESFLTISEIVQNGAVCQAAMYEEIDRGVSQVRKLMREQRSIQRRNDNG